MTRARILCKVHRARWSATLARTSYTFRRRRSARARLARMMTGTRITRRRGRWNLESSSQNIAPWSTMLIHRSFYHRSTSNGQSAAMQHMQASTSKASLVAAPISGSSRKPPSPIVVNREAERTRPHPHRSASTSSRQSVLKSAMICLLTIRCRLTRQTI